MWWPEESEERESAKEIIEQYKNVFEGELGSLEGEQTLTVDPTVPPNILPLRRVPFALKPKLENELKRLTDLGITKPVSNLVIATKESGDIRLCLDPKHLNRALKRGTLPFTSDRWHNITWPIESKNLYQGRRPKWILACETEWQVK